MFDFYINRPYLKPIYHIKTDNEKLWRSLYTAYKPFILRTCYTDGKDTSVISFNSSDNRLLINNTIQTIPYGYALQAIENHIYLSTTVSSKVAVFHAAVVAKDRNAFILGGFTGAGKSTLSAYLSRSGFEYISDDLAFIYKGSMNLLPFYRPLQLRKGGFDIIKKHGIVLKDYDIIDFGETQRIVVQNPKPRESSYTISGVFFINRTDNLNELCLLNKKQAYINMIKSQYIYEKADASLFKVIDYLNRAGIYKLSYYNMEYVRDILTGCGGFYG